MSIQSKSKDHTQSHILHTVVSKDIINAAKPRRFFYYIWINVMDGTYTDVRVEHRYSPPSDTDENIYTGG